MRAAFSKAVAQAGIDNDEFRTTQPGHVKLYSAAIVVIRTMKARELFLAIADDVDCRLLNMNENNEAVD